MQDLIAVLSLRKVDMTRDKDFVHVAAHILFFVLTVLLIIFCFIFYNWAGFKALLYIGWIMLITGGVLFSMSHIFIHKRGEVPNGKKYCDTAVIVDYGIYAIVRHPIFLSFASMVVALIFISQHWLSAVIGTPIIMLLYIAMLEEEQYNIKKFGNDYKRYMKKVPRINFLLGIMRFIRRRKRG